MIASSELHVWLANLDVSGQQLSRYGGLLSHDEQAKAARFRFERDQRHYTVARGVLRSLLARYTGLAPESLQFTYNQHGKPALAHNDPPRFNLAHSHGWALFGFTLEHAIGVDIEQIRPDFATDEIAQRFFSPAEASTLQSVPAARRTKAFFDCWTRKEAFIKAKGLGVFLGLHTFAVSCRPGEAAALLSHEGHPDAPTRWTISEVQAPEGYVAAVAVEARDLTLKSWTWNG